MCNHEVFDYTLCNKDGDDDGADDGDDDDGDDDDGDDDNGDDGGDDLTPFTGLCQRLVLLSPCEQEDLEKSEEY